MRFLALSLLFYDFAEGYVRNGVTFPEPSPPPPPVPEPPRDPEMSSGELALQLH